MSATVELINLTKTFGQTVAVDDLSFSVAPGRITGFLGPNGAGKSTSLRCLTGLVKPTSGAALIDGIEYHDLPSPIRRVGASLESTGFHPGRSGRNNLLIMALAAGLTADDVDNAIAAVGMTPAARKRTETYSMGMKQRLAIAAALLGDPQILLLDEPANGLDPEGIAWMRQFLRYRASQGATILISSHVLSEVQQTVDDVVIIAKGKLVHNSSLEALVASTNAHIEVVTPDAERFESVLHNGIDGHLPTKVRRSNHQVLQVEGLQVAEVGRLALHNSIELHGLTERRTDLEQVFLDLTGGES